MLLKDFYLNFESMYVYKISEMLQYKICIDAVNRLRLV